LYIKALILSFLLIGCGYKPTSNYVSKQVNGNVFVETKIDIENSQTSVLLKNMLNNTLINNLNINIVNNKLLADTIMNIELKDVKSKALQTSKDGYSLIYRVTVIIEVSYYKRHKKNTKRTTILLKDYADYIVDDDSKVTQENKTEAINTASKKAINSLLQKISKEEFRR